MFKQVKILLISSIIVSTISCSLTGPKPCFELKCESLRQLDCILEGEDVLLSNCTDDGMEFAWDFGDGTTSKLKSPHHTWEKAGNYTITLSVDNEKKTKTTSQDIVVSPSLSGRWVGECIASDTPIPISFNITQEAARIKGEFRYGSSSTPGVISSRSEISGDSVLISCSYVNVFFFDGEEFSFNSMFNFRGLVNKSLDTMQGDHFSIRDMEYGSWIVHKE